MSIAKSEQVLLASARDVAQVHADATADLAALRGKLSNLETEWRGRGGVAFRATVQRWDDAARRTLAALETFRDELNAAEAHYTATEDDVSGAFNRYAAGLG